MARNEFSSLISETRFNAVSALVVVERLVRAAPEDLSPDEHRALEAMQAARREVERVREERVANRPAAVRPQLSRFAAAWLGLSNVLAATAALPPEVAGAKAARAQTMRNLLFPGTGAPQLNVEAGRAYVEGRERLERIASPAQTRELASLIGGEHIDAARNATHALGDALGVGTVGRKTAPTTQLADALREVSRAVARYARKLVASVDDEDERSVRRFREALRPLAEHKTTLGRRKGAAEPPVAGG